MDRLACVDVAALPLQLLLCDHRDWLESPVAVVEDDRPQSTVLFVNAHARRLGVRSGQRYATALTIARDLRAGALPSSRLDEGIQVIAETLRRRSPHVEPSRDLPGVFWLDASGLDHLYPSLPIWARIIRDDLASLGLQASIVVGFTRFGVCALAVSRSGLLVCPDEDDERQRVEQVPIGRVNLEPDVRDRLLALGIETVGQFQRLPASGIRTRFGAAAEMLHQLATGRRWAPLVPVAAVEPYEDIEYFDAAELNTERLLFVVKRLIDGLAVRLSRCGEAIVEVQLRMTLDDRSTRNESIAPAAASLDVAQLLVLVRLRFDTLQLPAGVVALCVRVSACPAAEGQGRLLPDESRRDTVAANQALARLRAECGERHVVRAGIRDAHLPSAQFAWEPIDSLPARTTPRTVATRPLVRRILARPTPLPASMARRLAGAGGAASDDGTMTIGGPYPLSGAWWAGGVQRDYYYVRENGRLLWIYFDRRRRQYFLQGRVE